MPEQRTEEWFIERLGKATASRITDIMAVGRAGKPSATRENYLAELVVERLTGEPRESFTSLAMQWGTDTEPQARASFMLETGQVVEEVGFCPHPDIEMAGASPDGLIGDDGLIEIKCPNSATHIATLRGAEIDRKYLLQMQFQMACTGRQWCDFVSFDPRLPDEMQMHVRRVHADRELIGEIEGAVREFLSDVDDAVVDLHSKYARAA